MERNRDNASGGRLDLHLWVLSRVTLAFTVQTFEILLRMERGGINCYPGTLDMNLKPSKKTGTYVHPQKEIRKGVVTFFLLRWFLRKSRVFTQTFLLPFCNDVEIISTHVGLYHPTQGLTTWLMSLPHWHQDTSTSSALPGVPSFSPAH